jgi:hypothetical protein
MEVFGHKFTFVVYIYLVIFSWTRPNPCGNISTIEIGENVTTLFMTTCDY